MDNIKIGKAITELRKKQGYTQNELALKLNVSDKAVSKWERGLGLPDISVLSTLAMILDSDVESILEGNAKSFIKDKWVGVLNLKNSNIPIDTLIFDKTLIELQIGYFLLAGINEIFVICDDSDRNIIARFFKNLEINILFVDKLNNVSNNNIMYIYKPIFIYGQNLTRSFQKAAERKDGITILALPEHISNNTSIMYDYNHMAVFEEKNAIETAYKYNALPIIFFPKKHCNAFSNKHSIEDLIRKHLLYVEPMFRGIIYIPLNKEEDIEDSSKIIEIIQKRDYPIGDINEICSKRALK